MIRTVVLLCSKIERRGAELARSNSRFQYLEVIVVLCEGCEICETKDFNA